MEARNPTSFLVTLFAALAVLYPLARPARTTKKTARPQTSSPSRVAEPASHESPQQGFPNAKDLVSEFLFSQAGIRAGSGGNIPGEAYSIDFLIATVPDPISSRLPYFFDSFMDSLESAVEAAG